MSTAVSDAHALTRGALLLSSYVLLRPSYMPIHRAVSSQAACRIFWLLALARRVSTCTCTVVVTVCVCLPSHTLALLGGDLAPQNCQFFC
jgi:hypothetical protein